MKVLKWMFLLAAAILVSGCSGTTDNRVAENGFDFTENEAENGENGFNFAEDEVGPIDSSGSTGSGNEGGFDFSEEEAAEEEENPDETESAGPVPGNWVIKYDEGRMVCEDGMTMGIPASDPDTVSLVRGEDGTTIIVSGMGGASDIELFLIESGPGGAYYEGSLNAGGVELIYEVYFLHMANNAQFDWLEGSIKSEEQGCKVSRSFSGQPVQ